MAFTVKATVPEGVKWAALLDHLYQSNLPKSDSVENHFAWLLQIASWKFDLNWNPKEDYIELEIPFAGSLVHVSPEQDYNDYHMGVARDQIYNILMKVLELVPPGRVVNHFTVSSKRGK